jgi:gliding motility-associated-like protein
VLGCYKEYTETIEIGGAYVVQFPDVFTPNNDGINDFFQGEFAGITNFTMEIYDLWNNLLYADVYAIGSLGTSWGWDGNLIDGEPFTGKIFKYVFKGTDNSGEEVIISNQALLLR